MSTAADVPELVEAAAQAMSTVPLPTMDPDLRDALRRGARAALSVVPVPLRPIDPDDERLQEVVTDAWYMESVATDDALATAVLAALRDDSIGLPSPPEPDTAPGDSHPDVDDEIVDYYEWRTPTQSVQMYPFDLGPDSHKPEVGIDGEEPMSADDAEVLAFMLLAAVQQARK